jgi:tripartite-type tricarboxylate transporter receptor subunit TctC
MFKPKHVALPTFIALATFAAAGTASAQNWPTRPVTLVVPFAAGSSSDTAGRVLAVGLSEALGQQVIIENVGGGGGMTGTTRVAKAPPDGYQVLFGTADNMAIVPAMHKQPPYNSATRVSAPGRISPAPS